MSSPRITEAFKWPFFFLKFFGCWPGDKPFKFYKYYSFVILTLAYVIYNIFLTINLFYTPPNIELIITELIFYFTEIGIYWKCFTMIILRVKVNDALTILDSKDFEGDDDVTKEIIEKNKHNCVMYYKVLAVWSNGAFWFLIIVPLILCFIFDKSIELPICKYYFISDEIREKYFFYLFAYQGFGIFVAMMCNVSNDTLIPGFILMGVTQLKVLKYKLQNLKLNPDDAKKSLEVQDHIQLTKLNVYLKHYELILSYCEKIQKLFSVTILVQFGISSFVICIMLCTLLFSMGTQFIIFMIFYSGAMMSEIFVPSYMGTQLIYESESLVLAAYSCEWIPRSERFKRHLRLFMQRANTPLVISGINLFPLSLESFTSICNTAYSFFALIRNIQMRDT